MDVDGARIALCICDVWDRHWSRGATRRVNELAPRVNDLATALRSAGALVIHAPSGTLDAYEGTPARLRAEALDLLRFPPARPPVQWPALPIDDSDGGSDTDAGDGGETPDTPVWTRQHPAITIDHERDIISDLGAEIYTTIVERDITHYIITGVHANMCIINRTFGIKEALGWGVRAFFTRDLTDAMYNPARAPYVSHDEGTRLVTGYIERFLCPTILARDVARVASGTWP